MLRTKKSLILSKGNDLETERDFRRICSFYSENHNLDPELNEAYQEYIKAYHQATSLCLTKIAENGTNLVIYDTENETKEMKVLEIQEPLD
mmetsp:Transcript_438/g.456  ORF Transcript_438/g.456 Transcript_438/m.456 type:complete len:91 (+) Transcript_438:2-274(+)